MLNSVFLMRKNKYFIQIVMTSQSYCPILKQSFDRVKLPMLLIGIATALEAALFSNCYFNAEFVDSDTKIKDLVCK